MNAFVNPIPAIVASKFPNKVIIHSHSSLNSSGGVIAKFVHKINKSLFLKEKFVRLACSDLAGHWMFGNNTYVVVNNAVDLSRFKFNEQTRQELRHQLGINDEFVIGHVGRFVEPKNHKLLLKIFANYRREYPTDNAQLVLVGDGPLFEDIKALAEEFGIADSVHFIGSVDNPEKYYNVFDCFLFPSLFEGLGFVAIEAQACGLPVVASDVIPNDINVGKNVKFVSLSSSLEDWCTAIKDSCNSNHAMISSSLVGSKFDLTNMVHQMMKIYMA
jgi:glycosyltransferase involved in cell wall biosynthesis